MKDFQAIILGTDLNSYSVARSFYDLYHKKPLVFGAAVLLPFYRSEIAEVYTRENFSSDGDVLVELLNEVLTHYTDTEFVFFLPVEEYLDLLVENLDRLKFKFKLPYLNREQSSKYMIKSEFYKLMEKLDLPSPKTRSINPNNIESLDLDGDLFIKVDDYKNFVDLRFENKKKGYKVKGKDEAKEVLQSIFKAGYKGNILVQEYITGSDDSEYTLNGYRSQDGKISMSLARIVYLDKRDFWIGNFVGLIDAYNEEVYLMARKIVEEIDYKGLFNMDLKIDSKTGKIYIFEINLRQGRTFYEAYCGGIDLIKLTIDDLIFGKSQSLIADKKFRLLITSIKALEKNISGPILDLFNDESRIKNTVNPIINKKEKSFLRKLKLKNHLRKLDSDIFKR